MVNSVSTSAPDLYPTRVVDRFARRFRPHIRRFLPGAHEARASRRTRTVNASSAAQDAAAAPRSTA